MKKVAIFIEGESDMIFSSYLIKSIYDLNGTKLKYVNWTSDDNYQENFKQEEGGYKNIQIEFTLINFGNDKRVVNKLKENADSMLKAGYKAVIGLRDLGSREYDELAKGKIDSAITKIMISNTRDVLKGLEGVNLFFAVMELETWYLALTDCLIKAGYNLRTISTKIKVDLEKIDPENEFYNPKSTIRSFETKFKETDFAHKIGSKLELFDLEVIIKNGNKVAHFIEYVNVLKSYK